MQVRPVIPSKKKKAIVNGKRIVLVGKAEGWEAAKKAAGQFWVPNDAYKNLPADLAFEMHDLEKYPPYRQTVSKDLNEAKVPVMCQKHYDYIPLSIEYPLNEMPFRYFTSSVAYMIAYAIHQEAQYIDLYGINMSTREEYVRQRPCCEFWLGYARGLGIKVSIHGNSQLLRYETNRGKGLYGYEWDNMTKVEPYPDQLIINDRPEGMIVTRVI